MTSFVPSTIEMLRNQAEQQGKPLRLKRPTVQQLPLAAERGYVAALGRIFDAIIDDTSKLLLPELKRISRASGLRDDELVTDVEDVEAIIETIEGTIRTRIDNQHLTKLEELVRFYGLEATGFSRIQTIRQIRRMIGIDAFPREDGLRNQLNMFLKDNVKHIKSLGSGHVDRVMGIVRRRVRAGDRPELIEEDIRKAFKKTANNARLIARDQITKLNGSLTQMRQTSLGIEEYIWRTSRDERVRPSHREKEGKVFRWDSPPPDTGHPGFDILCRCSAEPVIEGVPRQKENRTEILRDMKRKRAAMRKKFKGKPGIRNVARESKKERHL